MAHQNSSHPQGLAVRPLPLLIALALTSAGAGAAYQPLDRLRPSAIGVPITFERNDGQFPTDVLFVSRGTGGLLELRSGDLAIVPRSGSSARSGLRFIGSNPAPEVEPESALVTRSHYYTGNDPRGFITGVPHFGSLRLKDVYPGIDVRLHGTEGELEYDFEVAPGADPRDIRIDLSRADTARIDADGNLRMETQGRMLTQKAPVAFQQQGSDRSAVDAHFEIVQGTAGPEARIALGDYDRRAALTVDPVIDYSTYVGSSGSDYPTLLKVDPSGGLYYVARENLDTALPDDVVVTRLDPSTNSVLYQTHFGGHGDSTAQAMALGGTGADTVYVVGFTSATDFPSTPAKSNASYDAFVTVVRGDGTLAASRVLGGTGSEYGYSIAVDGSGNVYVGGEADSADFPITTGGPMNGTGVASATDGFVAKLTPSLGVAYSRFIGGSGDDSVYAVAVDAGGQLVATGPTSSRNFQQVGARAPVSPAPTNSRGFLARFSADGNSVVHSAFIGGRSVDAYALALDPRTGDSIVVGHLEAGGAVVPATVGAPGGGYDAYVVRVDPTGVPTYGAALGGGSDDVAYDVAVSPAGDIYLTGYTFSGNFPSVNAIPGQSFHSPGQEMAFVTRIRDGVVDFSSAIGGNGSTFGVQVAVGPVENQVHVAGYVGTSLPTLNAYRSVRLGNSDGFITRITGLPARIAPALRIRYDANGDGKSDLLWRSVTGAQGLWFMNGTGAASYANVSAGTGFEARFVADFDGDGRADLVFRGADGTYKMQLLNGSTVTKEAVLLAGGLGWEVVGTGDFNGDGKADLLWRGGDGSHGIWLMNGTDYTGASGIGSPGAGYSVALVADFNGDGISDLVWTHPDGRAELWIMNASFGSTRRSLLPAGTGWTPKLAADFNGDGRADLLWEHTDGSIAIWLMNGVTPLAYATMMGPKSGWSAALAADLNGDGRADLLLRHVDGSVAGWLLNGTTISAGAILLNKASGWSLVSAGDFNGDRRADLVWRNIDGSHGVWLMNGLTATGFGSLLQGNTGWELAP